MTSKQQDNKGVNIWEVPIGDIVQLKPLYADFKVVGVIKKKLPTFGRCDVLKTVAVDDGRVSLFFRGVNVRKKTDHLWEQV